MSDEEKLKLIIERLPGLEQAIEILQGALHAKDGTYAIQAANQIQQDIEFCQEIANGNVV
jgi:hypothetical protein